MRNITGDILNKPLRLMSKFITTQCGVEYESNSRSIYYQLALYGDLKDPITFVSVKSSSEAILSAEIIQDILVIVYFSPSMAIRYTI